eukprot:69358_1
MAKLFTWFSFALLFTGLNAVCDFKVYRHDDQGSVAADAGYTLIPLGDLLAGGDAHQPFLDWAAVNNNQIQAIGNWATWKNCFYWNSCSCGITVSINPCASHSQAWTVGTVYNMCPWSGTNTLSAGINLLQSCVANGPSAETIALFSNCNYNDPCNGVVCSDTANPCTENVCVGGTCIIQNFNSGHSCADLDQCNGHEACDGNGACVAGNNVICDDNNICTDDSCDSGTGNCNFVSIEGRSCADSDICNGEEICDATGACIIGAPIECPFGERCDTNTGGCEIDGTCAFDIDGYSDVCGTDYQSQIDAVNARVDALHLTEEQESAPILSLDVLNKDLVIIGLLMLNVILFIWICCGGIKNKAQYKSVSVYSTDDEDKPINK